MILLFAVSLLWAFSFGLIKRHLGGLDSSFVAAVRETLKFLTTQVVAGYQQGGSSQFQPVGMATDQLRPAAMAPEDVLKVMDKMAARKALGFKN